MARLARIVAPGYPHHVTQRGNRRQPTFFNDEDYAEYRRSMGVFCKRCENEVWAYCLMPNHVHLIMVPRTGNGLRCAMAEVHRRYTHRIHAREGWRGHLWQERFHSFVMEELYLAAAVRYIENNPVRAGLCATAEAWPWSSAGAHLRGNNDELVKVSPVLALVADWKNYLREETEGQLIEAIHGHLSTGRPLGSDPFIERLEQQLQRTLRRDKPGPKPRATA